MNVTWRAEQLDEIFRFFKTSMTLPTLYTRVNQHNPQHSFEAIARQVRRYRGKGYLKPREELDKTLRIGYLDIETTNLKGDWGHMLTWYIKPRGSRQYDFSIITKQEIFDEVFDRRIVEELLKALAKYDMIWTHFGTDRKFDIPFLRTRAYAWGLENMLPDNMEKFMKDTWITARQKLALFSNRLEYVAQAVGVKGVKKTPLKPDIWQLARVGNAKALEYIATHNRHDVDLLERVQRKLEKIDRQPMKGI